MDNPNGFELIDTRKITEIDSEVFYYRHRKSGARLLSVCNNDENKVFGISFRTPPKSSNGIAHIMEHSVLCGSRKYPVKEPFVELIKGSLHTFLNAFTYPDKTCYPVASTNLQDFYNLIEVYLDAVFHPLIDEDILKQEGWHYELHKADAPLVYKGVVFNEMKGAYSSPNRLVAELSQQSLFPDTTYGVESGGHPEAIPDLTFTEFKAFHQNYYHPANAFIYFWGDDHPQKRFAILNEYLNDFQSRKIDSAIAVQKRFVQPVKARHKYFAGKDLGKTKKGVVTVNFLLSDILDNYDRLLFELLDHVLIGTAASPLRKALIDSGLGADLAGHGLETDLRQLSYSIGLRGIDPADGEKVEALIFATLEKLAKDGIDRDTLDASLNTIEFHLRENNTGSYPRGLSMMVEVLATWLHDENPIDALAYEAPLERLKSEVAADPRLLESLIKSAFLGNTHRTTLVFEPDENLESQAVEKETKKLQRMKSSFSAQEIEAIIKDTARLQEKQSRPDDPEDLAKIPRLRLQDLNQKHQHLPIAHSQSDAAEIVFHDLFTNGILYLELGFNLEKVPEKLLPLVRIFGRALLETGSEKHNRVQLTQRIGKHTGGLWRSTLNSTKENGQETTSWLFIKGKALAGQTAKLLEILLEILRTARLDNRERIGQIVRDARSSYENSLARSGHGLARRQLAAAFTKSGWINDKLSGISYLLFLRQLEQRILDDWKSVQSDLELLREKLLTRGNLVCNCTIDAKNRRQLEPQIIQFITELPNRQSTPYHWQFSRNLQPTGLAIPTQVNFVGKGINLYDVGYEFHGSVFVINNYLRTSWLWERVRVHGGAYGAFCSFNRRTGLFTLVSYRDPNLQETLNIFDETANFLRQTKISEDELVKSIIGTISKIDSYMLADAKGSASLFRYLTGTSDKKLQQIRDEILGTSIDDFKRFADALDSIKTHGVEAIVSSQKILQQVNEKTKKDWLEIKKIM